MLLDLPRLPSKGSGRMGWLQKRPQVLLTLIAVVVILALAVIPYVLTNHEDRTDNFGIKKIHPSAEDGMKWVSNWGTPREMDKDTQADPKDPWVHLPESGAEYVVDNGELRITGPTSRFHVRDPKLTRQWRDVEITMYFQRIQDNDTDYSGMVAVTRTNHGDTGSIDDQVCDTRGIGGRLRFDGTSDFEKEISHPDNSVQHSQVVWPGGMPKNVWLGYKFLVYDLPTGGTKLEMWLDETGGRDGGRWRLINSMVDTGKEFGVGMDACASGIDPSARLDGLGKRAGSESGKPNLSTYFRSDGVKYNGLLYREGSIREIQPGSW